MEMIFYFTCFVLAGILVYKKLNRTNSSKLFFKFHPSNFSYSVYQSPKVNGSKSLTLILEGNRIDELGYQIYKSYTADLDKIDILIRDNKAGEIMKIVKDGDSESMIGVSHPEHGHIGYLRFEIVTI